MRVLVTEDDEILARTIAAGLRREGMAVDVALDGAVALEHLAVSRYDVVVLDRDLPGVPGDDVCRTLAEGRSETRGLMLTAARPGRCRRGLPPQPLAFAELTARIRALGRRAAAPLPPSLERRRCIARIPPTVGPPRPERGGPALFIFSWPHP